MAMVLRRWRAGAPPRKFPGHCRQYRRPSTASRMSDEALMAAYQKGDLAAFEELVARHERRLWNFLRRFVRERTAAEDLLQEVFLRMIKSAPEWQPTAKVSTWLYTIARNLCTDHARRQVHRDALSLDAGSRDADSG